MKQLKLNISFTLLAIIAFLIMQCGSSARGALGGLAYSPQGNGFSYKSVRAPKADFARWASKNKGKIKKVIDSLEKGYVLEIVGHTDSSGPRNKTSNGRKGNIWYSTQRARSVYIALVSQGISRSRLRYKGIADDELLDSSEPRGQINRRVSFRVVKK